jgi:HEAT repeats
MLDRHDFIPLLVERFSDPDVSVRKYACFAYGNSAFHNNSLYPKLAPGIVPLVRLLSDPEPKTRLNAAGALGNLARNGTDLVQAMLQADAVSVRCRYCRMLKWPPQCIRSVSQVLQTGMLQLLRSQVLLRAEAAAPGATERRPPPGLIAAPDCPLLAGQDGISPDFLCRAGRAGMRGARGAIPPERQRPGPPEHSAPDRQAAGASGEYEQLVLECGFSDAGVRQA